MYTKKQVFKLWLTLQKEKIFSSTDCRLCNDCKFSSTYQENTKIYELLLQYAGSFKKCNKFNKDIQYWMISPSYCPDYLKR